MVGDEPSSIGGQDDDLFPIRIPGVLGYVQFDPIAVDRLKPGRGA
jgi:hypothetical protein